MELIPLISAALVFGGDLENRVHMIARRESESSERVSSLVIRRKRRNLPRALNYSAL